MTTADARPIPDLSDGSLARVTARPVLSDEARAHARQLARRHRAACKKAGCLAVHERVINGIARAHRAEQAATDPVSQP